MKKKRLTITQTLDDNVPTYALERSLGELVVFVTELAQRHGNDAYLDWQPDYYESRWDSSPSPRFWIRKERPETDKEYQIRVDKETAEKKQIADRELAELERLQKKYGRS
jgi:hypothetical protein